MILYKPGFANNKKIRSKKEIDISIEELPQRPVPKYNTPRDREKYIKTCESVIRKSMEYKDYIKFLKDNLDMNRCIVLSNLKNEGGKHYRIEIHHEPFTLFDIVETVIAKRIENEESIDVLSVADEVMDLHYSGMVGLIPLTITMHKLVHSGRIFVPLQYIYHKYNEFYKEYEPYISFNLNDKIEAKVNLSLQTENLVSDALDVEFTYLNIDGFDFPTVPDEWKHAMADPTSEADKSD